MGIEEILGSKREEILRIAARHGAVNVRIFGDVARGEAGPDAEIDLLIDVGEKTTPWFPGGLVADLEDLLGREVHSRSLIAHDFIGLNLGVLWEIIEIHVPALRPQVARMLADL